MKRIIVLALLTIAAASVAAGQCARMGKMHGNAAVEAIKRLETERNKALVAGDVAAIDRIYAADYTSAVNSTFRTKAEVLADLKSGALKLEAANNDETNVRVYGNTAVVTGKTTSKVIDHGVDRSGQTYFTRLLARLS
jgi:ketosteroid isomerase-like protein